MLGGRSKGGTGLAESGPAPEIGAALRRRAEEITARLVSQWRSSSDWDPQRDGVESDIVRSTTAGTLAVADYLVSGKVVTRDRSEEWDRVGESPLVGGLSLSSITKLYLRWRQVCADVIREEARTLGLGPEMVELCIGVVQHGAESSLVRMAQRFEVTRGALEAQLAEHRARLEHQALHDPLTGLANRVLLLDRIEHAVESASRRATRIAVLFMDIDYFKSVNDASGHSAGDQLLVQAARRLSAVVRPNDTVARLGGDEFVVLCEDLVDPVPEGVAVAERIASRFEEPFVVGDRAAVVAASIGVAVAEDGDTAEALLGRADHAMYRAKQLGRGRIEVYDPSIDHQETRRAEISAALHRAVADRQFRIVYQDVLEIGSRRVIAREALLRWRHPTLGSVPPSEFVPIAETEGLITSIGRWVLAEACRDCVAWRDAGEPGVGVSVNVSGMQLSDVEFPGDVEHALKESGLPPDALTVDVTETLFMTDQAGARDGLDRLRALGVRVAIDDFGTGYSLLSWLARLPVDVVKVDRSFVAALGLVDRQAAIVDTMIYLSHKLGLLVVAEGVETDAQLANLSDLGCDAAQGFLLGHPGPLTDPQATPLTGPQAAPIAGPQAAPLTGAP